MKTEHTPEPWFSQYDDNGFYEIGSESVSLRLAFTYGEGDTDEANARRIVACVNACAGVEDPSMYPMAKMLKLADEQRAACFALEKQRDELLAAAEAIEIDAEECLDFDECTAMLVPIDTYHKLMEAIASMKGGAA